MVVAYSSRNATLPLIVERIYKARDLYFAEHPRATKFTMVNCQDMLQRDLGVAEWAGEPWSISTIERARRDYPEYLPYKWPLHRWEQRPWAKDDDDDQFGDQGPDGGSFLMLPLRDAAGNEIEVPVRTEPNGVIRVLKSMPETVSAAAAILSGGLILDGMDGRADTIIHWCRVIYGMIHGRPL